MEGYVMKKGFAVFWLFALLLGVAACQESPQVIENETPRLNPSTKPSAIASASQSPISTPTPFASATPVATATPSASPETSSLSDGDEIFYADVYDLQFADLADLEFNFLSGVGAWGTSVQIHPDGTFSGSFHDSNAGSTGDGYPNGTRYYCSFSGQFSELRKTGDYEYTMKCESLTQEGTPGEVEIAEEEGVRYITSTPYGFDDADVFLLYLPGKKADELPEEFLEWLAMPRMLDFDTIDVLDLYGLYNVGGKQGFGASVK